MALWVIVIFYLNGRRVFILHFLAQTNYFLPSTSLQIFSIFWFAAMQLKNQLRPFVASFLPTPLLLLWLKHLCFQLCHCEFVSAIRFFDLQQFWSYTRYLRRPPFVTFKRQPLIPSVTVEDFEFRRDGFQDLHYSLVVSLAWLIAYLTSWLFWICLRWNAIRMVWVFYHFGTSELAHRQFLTIGAN